MKYRELVVYPFLLLLSLPLYAAQPIDNLLDVSIPTQVDGSLLSMDEVREAIVAGCQVKGWSPVLVEEGRFEASIQVRSHTAKIEIPFTQQAYSIRYLSSVNLDYNAKKQKIHRNYNKWVKLLSRAIQEELGKKI